MLPQMNPTFSNQQIKNPDLAVRRRWGLFAISYGAEVRFLHTILIIGLLTGVNRVLAQPQAPTIEWSRTYGGNSYDGCNDIKLLDDGGFVFAGSTWSFGNGSVDDIWLVRTESDGDSMWSRTFGGTGLDFCLSMDLTSDGGFILGGGTTLSGGQGVNCWIIKTDMNGDSLWSRIYRGTRNDELRAVKQVSDGGYWTCGLSSWLDSIRTRAFMMRLDSLGDSLWCRPYGGSGILSSLVPFGDGSCIAAGHVINAAISRDNAWLLRVAANGDSLWSREYAVGDDRSYFTRAIQSEDGNIVGFGYTANFSTESYNFFLVKTNPQGDTLWTRIYNRPLFSEQGSSIIQTQDGGFVLAGRSWANGGWDYNIRIIRTDDMGNTLWETTVGGDGIDQSPHVISTSDGGYLLSANTDSYGSGWMDVWLVKFSPEQAARTTPTPQNACLMSVFPNPFNSSAQISFTLPVTSRMSLRLYDVLGREVKLLMDETQTAGEHRVSFDGSNLSSSIYFCRMQAGNMQITRKIVLMK